MTAAVTVGVLPKKRQKINISLPPFKQQFNRDEVDESMTSSKTLPSVLHLYSEPPSLQCPNSAERDGVVADARAFVYLASVVHHKCLGGQLAPLFQSNTALTDDQLPPSALAFYEWCQLCAAQELLHQSEGVNTAGRAVCLVRLS